MQNPIREFEQVSQLAPHSMNKVFLHDPVGGSFARLERGELPLGSEFYTLFEQEGLKYGLKFDARQLFDAFHTNLKPLPSMISAIQVFL